MSPFDYSKFVSEMTSKDSGWADALNDALRGRLFLCALWMEALLAVKMVRGSGTRLRMETLPNGRDGFLLEISRECRVSFHLTPPNGVTVQVKAIGCHVGFDHDVGAPESMEEMRELAQKEIKAAIAVIVS